MVKRYYWIVLCIFLFSGCANIRHAAPPDLLSSARIQGMQDIRAIGGCPSDSFKNDFVHLLEQGKGGVDSPSASQGDREVCLLAISGGGANGAYGAGLLNGWTQAKNRPVFKVVTGISTGAIIAPLAFLGSNYDGRLKEIYSRYSTKDIIEIRPYVKILFSNSVASTNPLARLIERYYDADLLKQIAVEYNKGRRLYVGTTNLDAQRLAIWDMGKIASTGGENALKLFRKIILASASIPIAFPPVYLDVEINRQKYDEMHVDGGVTKQVFFLYDVLQGFDEAIKEKRIDLSRFQYKIYVIRNGYVDPVFREIPDKLFAIAERTVDTMINAQGIGDLYQLFVYAKEGRGDFNLASIPATYQSNSKELFDPVEMRELFRIGFEEASKGYPWKKSPPGYEEMDKKISGSRVFQKP